MSYTILRVAEGGVVFHEGHRRRIGPGLDTWALHAEPGIYRITADLQAVRLPSSRLRDGMPVRFVPSPLTGGPISKPQPPCVYDAVREPGVATLLTSPDGAEIWEACSAAVVAWDGTDLVLPPRDRPRVLSVSEAAIRAHLAHVEAPITRDMALLLTNAVGTFAHGPFPAAVRARIEALYNGPPPHWA